MKVAIPQRIEISLIVSALLYVLCASANAQPQESKPPARLGWRWYGSAPTGVLPSVETAIMEGLLRVGLLWFSGGGMGQDLQMKELRPAAPALNVKLEEIETQPDAKGLEGAFQTANQKQVKAIMTTASRPFFAARKRIVELAGKYRLPAIYPQKEFVDEGGLMSYGFDSTDLYKRAAYYVDKILKGAKPADLPVQQATKFEFVINLNAAKQIGLTIPNRVLERANQVIK